MDLRRVVVVGANRIPFARANSQYAHLSNQDMLTATFDGLVARTGLAGERVGEVAAGAVLKHARDFNLTRQAVLGSQLDPHTPACDVQMACLTSMQAALLIAAKIATGQIDSGIAGGSDTASDVPVAVNEGFREVLLDLARARTMQQRLAAVARLRPGQVVPELPTNAEARTGLSMGEHQAVTTAELGITRRAQDELAVASHHNLAAAYDRGFFDDLVTGHAGLTRDGNLRPDTDTEAMGELKTVFGSGPDATMTAGNSTALTDGASAVLLGSQDWAQHRNLPTLARIVDAQTAAVDHVHGGEGLLMAPTYAVSQLLDRQGLSLQDFDFYEIHEAFAATVLSHLAAWESERFCADRLGRDAPLGGIDRDKLNTTGSSLATGHPFAATGTRILATMAKLLADKGSGRGLISICGAGGLGVAVILEAVN
ncbi:MAG: acetyl-CoA C-acyltransferase [Micrococcales bacterium]|nr:MAG: acetyl-CoA C-acyltransferase [Micrococcales bacterium]